MVLLFASFLFFRSSINKMVYTIMIEIMKDVQNESLITVSNLFM